MSMCSGSFMSMCSGSFNLDLHRCTMCTKTTPAVCPQACKAPEVFAGDASTGGVHLVGGAGLIVVKNVMRCFVIVSLVVVGVVAPLRILLSLHTFLPFLRERVETLSCTQLHPEASNGGVHLVGGSEI